jgi:hypothetical protein
MIELTHQLSAISNQLSGGISPAIDCLTADSYNILKT